MLFVGKNPDSTFRFQHVTSRTGDASVEVKYTQAWLEANGYVGYRYSKSPAPLLR